MLTTAEGANEGAKALPRKGSSMIERGAHVRAELLPAEAVGELLSISTRQVWRLAASRKLPAPVLIGRRRRWRQAELMRWLDAGAPSRNEWEQMADCPG